MGWWADETKGYRLEDAETGKIITARDVRFVEDDTQVTSRSLRPEGWPQRELRIDALGPREVEKAVESAVLNAPTSPEEISTAQQGDSAPGPSTPDQTGDFTGSSAAQTIKMGIFTTT